MPKDNYTLEQKKEIVRQYAQEHIAALEETLKDYKGRPQTICPQCGRTLKRSVRLAGYRKSPSDPRTTCPNCFTRFQPKLVVRISEDKQILVDLYDKTHIFYKIGDWFKLSPEEIRERNVGVYYSCIYNFGSVKNAFKNINLQYRQEETPFWTGLIDKYFGKVPDQDIAKCVSVMSSQVSILRRKKGIKKFSSIETFRLLVSKK